MGLGPGFNAQGSNSYGNISFQNNTFAVQVLMGIGKLFVKVVLDENVYIQVIKFLAETGIVCGISAPLRKICRTEFIP